MTLLETIRLMEKAASRQPSINMVVENDIFRLNTYADARYGVFGWTQGQHTSNVDADRITYTFTLFYVDRLKADKSNQVEVQSVGIATLDNIIKMLNEQGLYCESYAFTTFNQRFLDECAGAFCNVSFSVPAGSVCAEPWLGECCESIRDNFIIY